MTIRRRFEEFPEYQQAVEKGVKLQVKRNDLRAHKDALLSKRNGGSGAASPRSKQSPLDAAARQVLGDPAIDADALQSSGSPDSQLHDISKQIAIYDHALELHGKDVQNVLQPRL